MALLYNGPNEGPQVHAFIVGIGNYPYLKGGTNEVHQTVAGLEQLGQLSSPSVSAYEFYKLLLELDKKKNLSKPLGSVELIVSPNPGAKRKPTDVVTEAATQKNIETAYYAWKHRADSHQDNIAIFFYSGHGLQKGEHYLLAEDFGQNPHNPWTGALAFDGTRTAFHGCQAQTQLFFVDSCRQITWGMKDRDLIIPPLEQVNHNTGECAYNLTMKAASTNEAAHGEKDQPSFFTKALVKGLKGHVAENEDDLWQVKTGLLANHIHSLMRMEKATEGYKQRVVNTLGESISVVNYKKPPKVMLEVTCNPDDAMPYADLTATSMDTQKEYTRNKTKDPWKVELSAGIYLLKAEFTDKKYKNNKKPSSVNPPFRKERMNCL